MAYKINAGCSIQEGFILRFENAKHFLEDCDSTGIQRNAPRTVHLCAKIFNLFSRVFFCLPEANLYKLLQLFYRNMGEVVKGRLSQRSDFILTVL